MGDYDEDGVADLMVKFDRAVLIAILAPGDPVVLTVTGTVAGEAFSGTDAIRVIDPGVGNQTAAPGRCSSSRSPFWPKA